MTDPDPRFNGSGEFPISSPEIDKLCPAMCRAQKAIKHAAKDKQNKFLAGNDGKGGYYADLASVMEACIEALNNNGLFVAQPVQRTSAGEAVLVTRLYHESGQFLQSVILLSTTVTKQEPEDEGPKIPGSEKKKESNKVQKTVAEITYLRRACLSALVGVAADDDDGNEAEGSVQSRPARPAQAQPPTAAGGAPKISR